MRAIEGKAELLRALAARSPQSPRCDDGFCTGLRAFDELAPAGTFRRGAAHELLSEPRQPAPQSVALCLALAACRRKDTCGTVVWSDPTRAVYPPALAAAGLDLRQLILIRPASSADELWALAECLRCPGVGATIAHVGRLTRVEARRLQLAAGRGGGVGLFLRSADPRLTAHYAAATRWLTRPVPGSDDVQRWSVELVHGHGGRVGESVLLEVSRDTGTIHAVRPPAAMADRPLAPPAARAPA